MGIRVEKGGVGDCWVFVLSGVSNYYATPWTVAGQAPLSMGFPRQEYWTGLPFPSPRDLLDLGIKPSYLRRLLAGGFFTTEPWGKPTEEEGKKQFR